MLNSLRQYLHFAFLVTTCTLFLAILNSSQFSAKVLLFHFLYSLLRSFMHLWTSNLYHGGLRLRNFNIFNGTCLLKSFSTFEFSDSSLSLTSAKNQHSFQLNPESTHFRGLVGLCWNCKHKIANHGQKTYQERVDQNEWLKNLMNIS